MLNFIIFMLVLTSPLLLALILTVLFEGKERLIEDSYKGCREKNCNRRCCR